MFFLVLQAVAARAHLIIFAMAPSLRLRPNVYKAMTECLQVRLPAIIQFRRRGNAQIAMQHA